MKFNKWKLCLVALAALALFTTPIKAQTNAPVASTNPPADFWTGIGISLNSLGLSSNPSNYAGAVTFGKSVSKDQYSGSLIVVENVNNNLGVIAGFDHLWLGGKTGSANLVSGGLTLKAQVHPLRWAYSLVSTNQTSWAYTLTGTMFGVSMVGTPMNGTSNDGGLCAINRAGLNLDMIKVGKVQLSIGGDYGNRTGAGNYSGNWVDLVFSGRVGF